MSMRVCLVLLLNVDPKIINQFDQHNKNQPDTLPNTNSIRAQNLQQRCDHLENRSVGSQSGCSNNQSSRPAPSDAPVPAGEPHMASHSTIPPSTSNHVITTAAPAPTQDASPSHAAYPFSVSSPLYSTRVSIDTPPEPREGNVQYEPETTAQNDMQNRSKNVMEIRDADLQRSIAMDNERMKCIREKAAMYHEEALYYKEKRGYLQRREKREYEEFELKKKKMSERDTFQHADSSNDYSDYSDYSEASDSDDSSDSVKSHELRDYVNENNKPSVGVI